MPIILKMENADVALCNDIRELFSDELKDKVRIEDSLFRAYPELAQELFIHILDFGTAVMLFLAAVAGLVKQYNDRHQNKVETTVSGDEKNPEIKQTIVLIQQQFNMRTQ